MARLAQQMQAGSKSQQVKMYKKGGMVEGSKAEEALDKKQGVKKACGGKVKK